MKRDQLVALLKSYGSCVVALSAGVDSAVVAKAAQLGLGTRSIAVTGQSASLAGGELEQAIELARLIGIQHEIVATDEFTQPDYLRNAPDRCYHCKTELYTHLERFASRHKIATIVNGANLDDRSDFRPGMAAASEYRVASPLIECQLAKAEVRALAADWDLPIWDKPATPCLSSRIAYGEEVTPERVAMIDQAEQYLRGLGLRELRVRYHRGDLARIEVPLPELPRLCEPDTRAALLAHLKSVGFKFIALDIEGFRSGSLNQLVTLDLPAAHD